MMTISGIVSWYYNTLIAWILYYMVYSFFPNLPWATCGNKWNTDACISSRRTGNQSDAVFRNQSNVVFNNQSDVVFYNESLLNQSLTPEGMLGNVTGDKKKSLMSTAALEFWEWVMTWMSLHYLSFQFDISYQNALSKWLLPSTLNLSTFILILTQSSKTKLKYLL